MFKNHKQDTAKGKKQECIPKLDMTDGSLQEGFSDDIIGHIYKKHRSTMPSRRREEPEDQG